MEQHQKVNLLNITFSLLVFILGLVYTIYYTFNSDTVWHYLNILSIFILIPAVLGIIIGGCLAVAAIYDYVEGRD